ncbi:MAG: transcriptional regulator, partial [Lachnospiraceae bacterium]|nr:transcriptional regulator [Lachnospiraceae bacterium]
MKREIPNEQSIVYTNDNCIGCNRCINVCSAIGACVSVEVDGKARIHVDGSRCVACGSCIDVCVHNAREYSDDTEAFFEDLKKGEPISLLLAPSFKANFPDEYESVIGGLKALGARRILSVSFGADITTWGYLNYIDRYKFTGGISQPCPAVVYYIERYLPELLPKLFPVQSPLMCSAIYARKELGITDKFAFISPCIAKKMEIEDPFNEGLVQYNVTFDHLMRYVREHGIKGDPSNSEIEYGLGSFYPTPGGLAENVRWFLGDGVYIRQIEGERRLYEWMHENASRIRDDKTPFLFIDALNCEKGCICGTAVNPEKSRTDDALY